MYVCYVEKHYKSIVISFFVTGFLKFKAGDVQGVPNVNKKVSHAFKCPKTVPLITVVENLFVSKAIDFYIDMSCTTKETESQT